MAVVSLNFSDLFTCFLLQVVQVALVLKVMKASEDQMGPKETRAGKDFQDHLGHQVL